uniref:Uncharacterized protein n=1 Tax=Gossypium raimondii TaxID=29730 RepID=A0A0D2U380_GOSRA|nr:hypothetical protein B456_009G415900 [Gossypium raimondii]
MKRVVHGFGKAFTCRLYVHRPVGKLEPHPQAPFLGRHLALALLVRLADAYSTRMYKPSSVHQAVTKISLFQITKEKGI